MGSRYRRDSVEWLQQQFASSRIVEVGEGPSREEIPDQLVQFFQSRGIPPLPPVERGDSLLNVNVEVEPEVRLNIDIGEDEEIVVSGGGNYIVDGFKATK